MKNIQLFTVQITRQEFLGLPLKTRGRILEQQTDDFLGLTVWLDAKQTADIRAGFEVLGQALADHSHHWTKNERRLYDRAFRLLMNPRTHRLHGDENKPLFENMEHRDYSGRDSDL